MKYAAPQERPKGLSWRSILLVGTSALLSGIAVVIWNRRSLQKMRESPVTTQNPEELDGLDEKSRSEEEFI